jgi:hypothetical protein
MSGAEMIERQAATPARISTAACSSEAAVSVTRKLMQRPKLSRTRTESSTLAAIPLDGGHPYIDVGVAAGEAKRNSAVENRLVSPNSDHVALL